MVDVPDRKVGIVACSGEELAEGTITRLAALKVLEQVRPGQTVTICLPLFLAGGEGDRAFARFHPTIALDGCDKRCAALGTERYSARPAASIVVGDVIGDMVGDVVGGMDPVDLGRARRLSPAGWQVVDAVAEQVTRTVDALLGAGGEHLSAPALDPEVVQEPKVATCSCGSGIPVQKVDVEGREVTFIALPYILAKLRDAGKLPGEDTTAELMSLVEIYNEIPEAQSAAYTRAIAREYSVFCARAR
jgi:uncharacterized metal-binding protein